MKGFISKITLLLFFLGSTSAFTASGPLFQVQASGNPAQIEFILCLNGDGPLSCQKYKASAEILSIKTTINRFYPKVGIKFLTPGYTPTGCTPYGNGYCIFSVNGQTPTTITVINNNTPTYTVTPTGDGNETINPNTPQNVLSGQTQSFVVTPNAGYTLNSAVGGTCPAGSWTGNSYTTGPIQSNCTVIFSATLLSFTVTPSGDGNETINPNTPQTRNYGETQSFVVTPNPGYAVDTAVGGTCPTGTWMSGTYTTGPIQSNCTVIFSATLLSFTVTPSGDGNETINPNTPQTRNYGETQSFVVTPNPGYAVDTAVGGTCPPGTWMSGTYTTGSILSNCTVIFSASLTPTSISLTGSPLLLLPNTTSTLTITNTGSENAHNVMADLPPGLASNVTQDASACTLLPPGQRCRLTFTSNNQPYQKTAITVAGVNTNSQNASIALDFMYTTNSVVNALLLDLNANTLYLGGSFTQIGINTGRGVPFDISNALPVTVYPRVNDIIETVVEDGNGGWYIGGVFTYVGNTPRNLLAHILADGSVDLSWNPTITGMGVSKMTLRGNTLYIAGVFTQINGQNRTNLAAFDVTTGNLTAWAPSAAGTVNALLATNSIVYLGGTFASVNGNPSTNNLAAVDATTGATILTWNANPNNTVRALALSDDGNTLYAGGIFTQMGGQTHNRLAALDATTGAVSTWAPSIGNNAVFSIAVSGDDVYVGGSFTLVNSLTYNRLAVISATSGNVSLTWNPNANNIVNALAIHDNDFIYAGGTFTTINSQTRNRLVEIDRSNGIPSSWDPNVGDTGTTVNTMAVSSTAVYAGGTFIMARAQTRNRLAAIDVSTGVVSSWNPNAGSTVNALAKSGNTVYAGGSFTTIGGQSINRLAAIDATTGAVSLTWNPNVNNSVLALATDGNDVYAGGTFTSVNGQTNNRLVAINTNTAVVNWSANIGNSSVNALILDNGLLYAGGGFSLVNGQTYNRLVALNSSTGVATGWNPNVSGTVNALRIESNLIYAGGTFTTVGGSSRINLAAIDTTTGMPTSLALASINGNISSLGLLDDLLYMGGIFTLVNGETRNRAAAVNKSAGNLNAFNPNAGANVAVLALSGSTVYIGGNFSSLNNMATTGLGLAPMVF